jgi:hypothetical protein
LLLAFDNEAGAQIECDRLNARSGNPHVHYSFKAAVRSARAQR